MSGGPLLYPLRSSVNRWDFLLDCQQKFFHDRTLYGYYYSLRDGFVIVRLLPLIVCNSISSSFRFPPHAAVSGLAGLDPETQPKRPCRLHILVSPL